MRMPMQKTAAVFICVVLLANANEGRSQLLYNPPEPSGNENQGIGQTGATNPFFVDRSYNLPQSPSGYWIQQQRLRYERFLRIFRIIVLLSYINRPTSAPVPQATSPTTALMITSTRSVSITSTTPRATTTTTTPVTIISSTTESSTTTTTQGPAWTEWGQWTACTENCGGGRTRRERTCLRQSFCTGSREQEVDCNERPCTTDDCTGMLQYRFGSECYLVSLQANLPSLEYGDGSHCAQISDDSYSYSRNTITSDSAYRALLDKVKELRPAGASIWVDNKWRADGLSFPGTPKWYRGIEPAAITDPSPFVFVRVKIVFDGTDDGFVTASNDGDTADGAFCYGSTTS